MRGMRVTERTAMCARHDDGLGRVGLLLSVATAWYREQSAGPNFWGQARQFGVKS